MTAEPSTKVRRSIFLGVLVLVLFVALVGIPPFLKYQAYEVPTGVPCLRANIGKRVQIPQQSYVVLGERRTSGPHTGVLRRLDYRFSGDPSGFFDCEV